MFRKLRELRRRASVTVQTRMLDPQRLLAGQAALDARRASGVGFRFLFEAELQVFSQWGEDGILDFLCHSLDLHKPRMLEFGCGNFLECNSRFLVEARNARAVVVDSRSDLRPTVLSLSASWRTTLVPVHAWITPASAESLQNRAIEKMGGVDILSIDLDGVDYWVAERLDWGSVKIAVVEYNPIFGAQEPVSVLADDSFDRESAHFSCLYYGASLQAWVDFFNSRDMVLVGTNLAGNNAFFVKSNLRDRLPVADFDQIAMDVATDWGVQEARNSDGSLARIPWPKAVWQISHLPLINTESRLLTTLAQVRGL